MILKNLNFDKNQFSLTDITPCRLPNLKPARRAMHNAIGKLIAEILES
jgi:hypothetical protein